MKNSILQVHISNHTKIHLMGKPDHSTEYVLHIFRLCDEDNIKFNKHSKKNKHFNFVKENPVNNVTLLVWTEEYVWFMSERNRLELGSQAVRLEQQNRNAHRQLCSWQSASDRRVRGRDKIQIPLYHHWSPGGHSH